MAGGETMGAWVIRPDRLGDPEDAMQLEQIEVPEPGPGEVLVRVMAAGVNYNGVWASLGLPVSIFRYTGYDFHIAGSDASGIVERGRPGRHPLEARRRGRHPLQPELRRVPRVQRPRPDGLHAAEDLGVRVQLGQLRRVLQGAGPAAPAQAAAADLGGGRLATGSPTSPPTGCWSTGPSIAGRRQRAGLGRRRRPGHVRGAALRAATAPTRSPSSRPTTRSSSCASWAPRR